MSLNLKTAAAFAALAIAVCLLRIVHLQIWIVDNDNYATLGTFIGRAGHPEYPEALRKFYDRSKEACSPDDAGCTDAIASLYQEQTYARPIVAYFGSFLAQPKWLLEDGKFLEGIEKVTLASVAFTIVATIVLLFWILLLLPPSVNAFVAAVTALFGGVAFWFSEHSAYWQFQPLLGVTWTAAAGAVGLAGLLLLYVRGIGIIRTNTRRTALSHRAVYFVWACAIAILFSRWLIGAPTRFSGYGIFGSEVGLLPFMHFLAGIAVFLLALTWAAPSADGGRNLLFISAFLLFGFVTVAESYFTTMFHISSRGSIYVLASPFILYVAIKPNGKAILLLPLLAIFHVSIAGLLSLCILCVEIVACVRRSSISFALIFSALFFVGALLFTLSTSESALGGNVDSISLLWQKMSVLEFLAGLPTLCIMFLFGLVAWRMTDPAGDMLLRAIVLATMLLGAGQLRESLEAQGVSLMDAKLYAFTLLWFYLAPIVCPAGTFLVMFALATSRQEISDRTSANTFVPNSRILSLATAGVLALMAVRSDSSIQRPPNPFEALFHGLQWLAEGKASIEYDPLVVRAAGANDNYIVGPRPSDRVTTMSLLKMKARSAAGLLDPDVMTIVLWKEVR